MVCHFYHDDFLRCKIVDKHLRIIANLHPECSFVHLNVQKAPFIVNKLQVRVLPTIGIFIDGILIESITGFEEFGGIDDFKTLVMTRRLASSKVLKLREEEKFKMTKKKKKRIVFGESDSDTDEEE